MVLADVRWYLDGRSGRAAFEAGHAPGAVYIDLDEALAGPPSPERGRHPLPEPAVFAAAMARAGISDDTTVVAYDDAGGVIAARLVWLLRATGHSAALLDGGLAVFGVNLETGPHAAVALGQFKERPWPSDRLASIDEAVEEKWVVIDARNRDRYDGAPDPVDPRFGHIPGAHSVPCRENVVDGFVKSPEQLRATFEAAGVTEGACAISYCGSGVTACHNLLTLEWAGLGRGRLFPGSWSQYSNDLTRPIA
jgi:thiosulfate/3-mercaptopyruvate sulfurtransferase